MVLGGWLTAMAVGCVPSGNNAGGSVTPNVPADAGSEDVGSARPATSSSCRPCQHDQECGPNAFCTADPSGAGLVCGMSCLQSTECPNGYSCSPVLGANGQAIGGACLPANNASCFPPGAQDGGMAPDAGLPVPQPDAGPSGPGGPGGPNDAGAPPTFTPCTADGWNTYASTFFSTNCARCHAQLSTLSGVAKDARRIESTIRTRQMPKDRTLPPVDIMRINRWMDCDLPP